MPHILFAAHGLKMGIFSIFRHAKTLVKQGFRNFEIRNFLPKMELF